MREKMKNIYLAARFERQHEMRGYRRVLNSLGYSVSSRWLDQISADGALGPIEKRNCAQVDLQDIRESDTLILFTSDLHGGYSTAAHKVEFGIAIAMGMRLIVIGQYENVFCHLPKVHQFDSFKEFKEYLDVYTKDSVPTPL